MKPTRRYLTFSLRTFFVLLTAFAVWLGLVVKRAREQAEAVEAIQSLGGLVVYDWHLLLSPDPSGNYNPEPEELKEGPAWLQRIVGDDYFQEVVRAELFFSEDKVLESIPHLKRLPRLKEVHIGDWMSEKTEDELSAALPYCRITVDTFDHNRCHVISERQLNSSLPPNPKG